MPELAGGGGGRVIRDHIRREAAVLLSWRGVQLLLPATQVDLPPSKKRLFTTVLFLSPLSLVRTILRSTEQLFAITIFTATKLFCLATFTL
jgi:hypothetical protein